MSYLPPLRNPIRTIGRRTFDFDHEIVVMGIVNRTPDSFFDQGRTYSLDHAVAAALDAAEAGAGDPIVLLVTGRNIDDDLFTRARTTPGGFPD